MVTDPVVISSDNMKESSPVKLRTSQKRHIGWRGTGSHRGDTPGRIPLNTIVSVFDSDINTVKTYRAGVEIRHGETNLAVWLEASRRRQHLPADKRSELQTIADRRGSSAP